MKRILAILLLPALLLPLAACTVVKTEPARTGTGETAETEPWEWYPYDLSEYVELIDWRGVRAEFDDPDVCTEQEIDDAVLQVMLSYAEFTLKDGPAEKYDEVSCDIYQYFGDLLLEDLTVAEQSIVVGQSSLSDTDLAISKSMIGCGAGDICYAEYTYPDSVYMYGDLAGVTVRLVAEIHAVYSPTIPPCDEEFVQSLPDSGFQTVADFREAVKLGLIEDKEEARMYAVWKAFFSAARVLKYPEKEIREYEDDYLSYYRETAEEYGLDMDEFLQKYFNRTLEEFEQEAREYAENEVRNEMIFTQLSRILGTTVSDEEYLESVHKFYDREKGLYNSLEEYVDHYGENILRVNALWDKSLRIMAERAVRIVPETEAAS